MKKLIKNKTARLAISIFLVCLVLFILSCFVVPKIYGLKYVAQSSQVQTQPVVNPETASNTATGDENIIVTHLAAPKPLKAIYMTSWVAGDLSFRNKLIKMIDDTELNAVVIDVKDTTGKISFAVNNPNLKKINSAENRIKDIKSLIDSLHKKNIYVIGRIATFQDSFLAKKWPADAVKKLSDKTALWQDNKCKREVQAGKEDDCTYWLDPGSKEVWGYIVLGTRPMRTVSMKLILTISVIPRMEI